MVIEFNMANKPYEDVDVDMVTPKKSKQFHIITHGQTYKQQNTEKISSTLKVYSNEEEVQCMVTTQERVKEDKTLATHDIMRRQHGHRKTYIELP